MFIFNFDPGIGVLSCKLPKEDNVISDLVKVWGKGGGGGVSTFLSLLCGGLERGAHAGERLLKHFHARPNTQKKT